MATFAPSDVLTSKPLPSFHSSMDWCGESKSVSQTSGGDRHVVVDGDDRAIALHAGGLQRLPVLAENHALVINLPVFLAELAVSVGGQVNAFRGRVLVFRAGADDVRRMVNPGFPLRQRGGGTVVARVLLRDDHQDFLLLSGDGREVGVVVRPQLGGVHFHNSRCPRRIRRG